MDRTKGVVVSSGLDDLRRGVHGHLAVLWMMLLPCRHPAGVHLRAAVAALQPELPDVRVSEGFRWSVGALFRLPYTRLEVSRESVVQCCQV